jgi:3-oxoacyl-[acyl-carrier-protein] synthase II
MMDTGLTVTGWSLYLPGADIRGALEPVLGRSPGGWAARESPGPEQAFAVVGRKGLLSKEPATRLALCAVHRALGLPPGQRPGRSWPPASGTAVVACSNLGNVGTVAAVTRTVAAEGGRGISILDAPNASSNVVASTVALWFGFGGPNLMVCSGSTAGLDGLRLARLLLRAGRAGCVILVGAEPDDEVAGALYGDGGRSRSLRAGAACLVLEAAGDPGAGPAASEPPAPAASQPLVPAASRPPAPAGGGPLEVGPGGFDPAAHWGGCYGADGVVALALAAHLAADEGCGTVPVHCNGEDGSRHALVTASGPTASVTVAEVSAA